MELLAADDPRLAASRRPGDAWAAIAPVRHLDLSETRSRMRDLLVSSSDPFVRTERPGHFTGSGLVVAADCERTLLLLHAKLGIWVQPGGHADGDANLASVALREATEETGIAGLRVCPVAADLDIHEVVPPDEDAHFHHDVRFVIMAPPAAAAATNNESTDHRWVTRQELDSLGVDAGTRRLVERGLAAAQRLAGGGLR